MEAAVQFMTHKKEIEDDET